MKKIIAFFFLSSLLTSCTLMRIEDFHNTKPKMIVQEYFNGRMSAYGLVKNRNGKIIRTFKGELVGTVASDGVITLDELFVYDDGEKLRRVWTLKPNGYNSYIGTAGDIIGESIMKVSGNTIMMDYVMEIIYRGNKVNINVKDWLHLQEDGVIINHSKMKKFGIVVGELVITIIKHS